MRAQIASRAILIFENVPRMWIFLHHAELQHTSNATTRRGNALRVSEDDSRPTSIFYDESRLSFMSSDTTDSTTQMISQQSLDILDFERFDVKFFESEEGERVG